ncbi:phosphotransferase family protein [Arcanobacterium canis]
MTSTEIERADLAALTDETIGNMLTLFLGEDFGLTSWRVHAIHHRVGGGVSVGYSVRGHSEDTYVIASSARVDEASLTEHGGNIFDYEGRRYFVWRFPFDPQLPGLALACKASALSDFLGMEVEVELLAYRPTRRAVVKATGEQTYFVKVVPPVAVQSVIARLTLARESLPSPKIVRATDDGVVVCHEIPGVPLSRFLSSDPTPQEIDAMFVHLRNLLDAMSDRIVSLKPRKAWAQRADAYGVAAAAAFPEISDCAIELGKEIRRFVEVTDYGPVVPTHGDSYEANVFVDPAHWQISGIIDIDTLGPGHRAHDWGCLLGHMSVLEDLSPVRYQGVARILQRWRDLAAQEVGQAALGASAAGVVLSLVAGPAKARKRGWQGHCQARFDIARQWFSYAQGAGELFN